MTENNMCEYESLRNEIVSQLESKRNIWIYMYVLYLTMFSLGIEVSYYFLLITYIVIIPFQGAINSHARAIRMISTYIRIYYEEKYSFINWETFCVSDEYNDFHKTTYKGVQKVLHMGSVQLGGLSTILFVSFVLKNNFEDNMFILGFSDIFFIIIAVLLFVFTYLENKRYKKESDIDLKSIILSFRNGNKI